MVGWDMISDQKSVSIGETLDRLYTLFLIRDCNNNRLDG